MAQTMQLELKNVKWQTVVRAHEEVILYLFTELPLRFYILRAPPSGFTFFGFTFFGSAFFAGPPERFYCS